MYFFFFKHSLIDKGKCISKVLLCILSAKYMKFATNYQKMEKEVTARLLASSNSNDPIFE